MYYHFFNWNSGAYLKAIPRCYCPNPQNNQPNKNMIWMYILWKVRHKLHCFQTSNSVPSAREIQMAKRCWYLLCSRAFSNIEFSFNRFEFLQPWHQYNAYYEFKKQFFLQKESNDNCQVRVRLYILILKMQFEKRTCLSVVLPWDVLKIELWFMEKLFTKGYECCFFSLLCNVV